tara:strand:+ start:1612 stop:2715 length:1104 start_codon:yes stop_codon:yes gene_type:complete
MADPVDYFMQGVGLGQRSRSMAIQQKEFDRSQQLREQQAESQRTQFAETLSLRKEQAADQRSQFDRSMALREDQHTTVKDHFSKELGFRKDQSAVQQHQFSTNLAERSRQFAYNIGLQYTEHDLRNRAFTHKQEQAVIENKYLLAQTNSITLRNNEQMRLANNQVDFEPALTGYEISLTRWDGDESIPPIPPGLPMEQFNQAVEMQKNAVSRSLTGKMQKAQSEHDAFMSKTYFEGFNWARENATDLLTQDPQSGQWGYNYKDLLKRKEALARTANFNRQYGLRGMGLVPATGQTTDPLSGAKVGWGAPAIPAKRPTRAQWLEENIGKFISNGEYNAEDAEAAWRAIEGIRAVNNVEIDANAVRQNQ